jgi:hypothetical protein
MGQLTLETVVFDLPLGSAPNTRPARCQSGSAVAT